MCPLSNYLLDLSFKIYGLKYVSCARPQNAKGVSYGGTAIVVNLVKFKCEVLEVPVPSTHPFVAQNFMDTAGSIPVTNRREHLGNW